MSYLDTGKEQFNWVVAPARASIQQTPGCVQCGSRLEMTGQGQYSLSGRCVNCMNRHLDDEVFFCSSDDSLGD